MRFKPAEMSTALSRLERQSCSPLANVQHTNDKSFEMAATGFELVALSVNGIARRRGKSI